MCRSGTEKKTLGGQFECKCLAAIQVAPVRGSTPLICHWPDYDLIRSMGAFAVEMR